MKSYKTIKSSSSDEFIVKKSRFIGYVKPVTTEKQAQEFIAEIKSKHWDATHNVYAYSIKDTGTRRFSDDGEPQGTAGIPTLDVLMKEDVVDCCVVVTRYFGGIMLGAGGLVRAYSHGAKIALDAGKIITMSLCKIAHVVCDYNFYGRLVPLICENNGVVEDTVFTDNVEVIFRIPCDDLPMFDARLIDVSCGKFKSEVLDEKFCEL